MRGNEYLFHLPNPCIRISIHASTWEATRAARRTAQPQLHFNSRLYMRGNLSDPAVQFYIRVFQFTPLHERQLLCVAFARPGASISIHASTWEATESLSRILETYQFQFTPLHERQLSDRFDISPLWVISIHASTWEATAVYAKFRFCIDYFNSRLYMRGNRKITPLLLLLMYFNSRLYMRGNSEGRFRLLVVIVFQFTPLHERQPKKH